MRKRKRKRRKSSVAERMIGLAIAVLHPKDEVADGEGTPPEVVDVALARVKTSLDFYRARPGLKFQAIVEGWDAERINRELY